MPLVIQNPWYLVTLVAFAAGNRPDAVPLLFNHVLRELERAQHEFEVPEFDAHGERLLLARKFRDAIFKSGMTGGYSKVFCLPSWTGRCSDKLSAGNKCPGLFARGYARRITRQGTTEVSDIASTPRGLVSESRVMQRNYDIATRA